MTHKLLTTAIAASAIGMTCIAYPAPARAQATMDKVTLVAQADAAGAIANAFAWLGWIGAITGSLQVIGGVVLIVVSPNYYSQSGTYLGAGIGTVVGGTLSLLAGIAGITAAGKAWDEEKTIRIKLGITSSRADGVVGGIPAEKLEIHRIGHTNGRFPGSGSYGLWQE